MRRTISILGCGWYGLELAKHLVSKNFRVKGSTTSTTKLELLKNAGIEPYLLNFNGDEVKPDADFFKSHTLVICIPPKRNTAEQANFTNKITQICNAATDGAIENVLFISSTAVYGDSNNKEIYESDQPDPDTPSGTAMFGAEKILNGHQEFKLTVLRFGGLVGPQRDPGRFFAGKANIANGLAPINLIHLTDCIGISTSIIENKISGHTFNACAPDHPAKQGFYTQAAINSGLTPPTFINELKNWKIINSQLVSVTLNYKYQISNWAHWLYERKL